MKTSLSTHLLALRPAAVAILVATCLFSLADIATAGGFRTRPQGDMFYNYYKAGSAAGGVPAQMYPSPLPVPPRVGGTYMTYQPFYPHEFMYPHARTYRRYNGPFGVVPVNTTRAIWW